MAFDPTESLRPFIDEADIRSRIRTLVREISADLQGPEIVAVGILKKSFVFYADLIRRFHAEGYSLLMDFLSFSSDESKLFSSGKLTVEQDITEDVAGKCVLYMDDIIDTGYTAAAVHRHLMAKNPRTLRTCVLLDKRKKREVDFNPDYVGFTIPDVFVVGYGLGYNHRCRELPSLSVAEFEEIDKPLAFSIKNGEIILVGSLDAEGADYIHETLMHWNGDLRLDLAGLGFISSAGLGLLIEAQKELKRTGHRMRLLNPRSEIRQVLAIGEFEYF
ncbi:MAG TPA: hypoxanthine phosphoribosyltransferase [bacterium]